MFQKRVTGDVAASQGSVASYLEEDTPRAAPAPPPAEITPVDVIATGRPGCLDDVTGSFVKLSGYYDWFIFHFSANNRELRSSFPSDVLEGLLAKLLKDPDGRDELEGTYRRILFSVSENEITGWLEDFAYKLEDGLFINVLTALRIMGVDVHMVLLVENQRQSMFEPIKNQAQQKSRDALRTELVRRLIWACTKEREALARKDHEEFDNLRRARLRLREEVSLRSRNGFVFAE